MRIWIELSWSFLMSSLAMTAITQWALAVREGGFLRRAGRQNSAGSVDWNSWLSFHQHGSLRVIRFLTCWIRDSTEGGGSHCMTFNDLTWYFPDYQSNCTLGRSSPRFTWINTPFLEGWKCQRICNHISKQPDI